MRSFLSIVSISIVVLIFIGCGQPVKPPLYNWGNYVESSSDYGMYGEKKEILEIHILELEKIINESESKDKRVAPGIYAEYAQLLYETNKKESSKKYFILEKNTYPESIQFIDRVMVKLFGEQK